MKVVIVSTFDFWNQDHLWIAENAYKTLKENKHTVDLIHLPFNNDCLSYFEQMLAYRSLDLNVADVVITFGPFSHVIEHRKKIAFMTNHLKNFYELWNSPYGELATEANAVLKEKINHLDMMSLSESKKIFCFYENVKNRFSGMVIDVSSMPKVTRTPSIKNETKKNIISLGNFDSDFKFDLLVNSLSFMATLDFKLTLAGKKKRIDIYDSIQKAGKNWLDAGVLELIDTQTSDIDPQILSQADLFIDAGSESDVLSPSIYKGIQYQKPISGIQGCGFFEKTIFAQNGDFLFPNEPKALGQRLDQFLKTSSDEAFKSLYAAYDKAETIDWEQVIS